MTELEELKSENKAIRAMLKYQAERFKGKLAESQTAVASLIELNNEAVRQAANNGELAKFYRSILEEFASKSMTKAAMKGVINKALYGESK